MMLVKEITIKELATLYNVSDRIIQSKMKKLGYKWDHKQRHYHYVGEGPEPLDIDFRTLFGQTSNMLAKQ